MVPLASLVFFHSAPGQKKDLTVPFMMQLDPSNLISICVLATKNNTQKLKERQSFYFLLKEPQLLPNGTCVPVGHCTNSQALQSDRTLPPSIPVLHRFLLLLIFHHCRHWKTQLCKDMSSKEMQSGLFIPFLWGWRDVTHCSVSLKFSKQVTELL